MKTLNFIRGGAYRKVVVKGRTIALLTAELNDVPLVINLDKLDEQKDKMEDMGYNPEDFRAFAELQTEDEICEDIIKDFKQSGWLLHGTD